MRLARYTGLLEDCVGDDLKGRGGSDGGDGGGEGADGVGVGGSGWDCAACRAFSLSRSHASLCSFSFRFCSSSSCFRRFSASSQSCHFSTSLLKTISPVFWQIKASAHPPERIACQR